MIIDFHSHILPNIDDGSRSPEISCQMLADADSQGVEVMVATPHFYADRMQMGLFLTKRDEAYERVMECPDRTDNITILKGAEAAFFSGMSRAEELDRLCIEGTRLLLLEMPFRPWTGKDLDEVERLINRKITPVIAHLERFYGFQRDKALIPELLDMPVYIQMNAECLLDWRLRRTPLKLFKTGQAHLLGSDAHSRSHRPPNLDKGRAVLEKKLGHGVLERMDRLGEELLFHPWCASPLFLHSVSI